MWDTPDHRPSLEMTRRHFLWLTSVSAAGLAAGLTTGCAVNPVTGENQFMLVSEADEIAMDRQASPQQLSADYGVVRDTTLDGYIASVGRKLAPLTHRPRMPYNFRVVNATYVNAYAFPGGTIAATRGILLKLDNEAELAALLGHELGHVNARHTAQQMSKGQLGGLLVAGVAAAIGSKYENAGELAGQLGQIGAGMLLASYSRDNERQADALGNEYMVKAGYGTQGFVGLMDMLNQMNKTQPGYAELLFSTHPMSIERHQAAVEAARTTYAGSTGKPLNRDRYMDGIASLRRIEGAISDMQKADGLMARKEYDNAGDLLKGALKKAPDDYAALAMMSKCLLAQNQYAEASRYADDAKRAYPGEIQAYHLSGIARLKQRQFEPALRDFTEADRRLPGNPSLAFFKGFCHEGMGRRESAAAEYKKYLQSVNQGEMAQHAAKRLVEWGYAQPRS